MTITELILKESHRFEVAYKIRPDWVFIGRRQADEIDAVIANMRNLGLITSSTPIPRATINGFAVFRVDADTHLSFGVAQPSPCG